MTALKWITTEAKKIRKKYPKKEWKECVAQASAIYASKHKGKSPVGKKKTIGAVKKVAKKKTSKKSNSYHKDKNSHNVRINVVSGFNFTNHELDFLEKEGKKSKGFNYRAKILWGSPIVLKETKSGTPVEKFYFDNFDKCVEAAKELNKGQKYTKIKKSKSVK